MGTAISFGSRSNRRAALRRQRFANSTVTARSGAGCPVAGEWEIIDRLTTTAVLARGQPMPVYFGQKVDWVLVRKG